MEGRRCEFVRAGIFAVGWKWLWRRGLGAFLGARNFGEIGVTVRTVAARRKDKLFYGLIL